MPTPTSISSSGRSKPGLPAAGVVQAVSATANEPLFSLTRRPTAATSAALAPSSASAPAIFSTNTDGSELNTLTNSPGMDEPAARQLSRL